MDHTKKSTAERSYKETLNLPATSFPIRPASSIDDPACIARWKQDGLYDQLTRLNDGAKTFILHVGPPYANGHLHIGHAYNMVLKDIITKAYRMAGYHVPVIPGWDCHGLPIEIKVTSQKPGLNRTELIASCREYAANWITVQKEEAQRIGIVMDWDNPYITMDPHYEAGILEAFAQCVASGAVARLNKTVPWCPSCQTVLASAEIEYANRRDPSVIVRFDLLPNDAKRITGRKNLGIAVWTTSPWSLPLNRAVMIHPDQRYAICSRTSEPESANFLIGETRIDAISAQFGDLIVEGFVSAERLIGVTVHNPVTGRAVPIIADNSVSLDEGTAAVSIAPGCGPIDYEIGVKNGLEIASPISPDGKFDDQIDIPELRGVSVTNAQGIMITQALERGTLIHKASISHSYPHCWRCRNGLIFRATPQWFIRLDSIKEPALGAIAEINFVPTGARNFLTATVENRWEWCISRQRTWGVPIPAVLCTSCGSPYMTTQQIQHVANAVRTQGVEWWWKASVRDVLGSNADMHCTICGKDTLVLETAILDVWFDAGVSNDVVLKPRGMFPADLYLEGVDQHRGWFQSSLLTSIILHNAAPMKTIMSHGYVVDAQGHKMSKSRGNVIAPSEVIEKIGTDGLRLWAASVGYDAEVVISETVISSVGEAYRKIRNTLRGLLMNLYDFDPAKDTIAPESLTPIDAYFLSIVSKLNEELIADYLAFNATGVMHKLLNFCTHEISAFYLDVMKDRLYCDARNSHTRRSTQTVIWHTLDTLNRLAAPILSFTAEYISDLYIPEKRQSIHTERFAQVPRIIQGIDAESLWSFVRELRATLLKTLERQREIGTIKHSLEAEIVLYLDPKAPHASLITELLILCASAHITLEHFLAEIMIVSRITLSEKPELCEPTEIQGVRASAGHVPGMKCPRCWQWHENSGPDGLCHRCSRVISQQLI